MGEGARGSMGVDLEQRGIHTQPEVERHTQVMAGWEGDLTIAGMNCTLDLNAAVDLVENKDYIQGEEDTGYYVSTKINVEL